MTENQPLGKDELTALLKEAGDMIFHLAAGDLMLEKFVPGSPQQLAYKIFRQTKRIEDTEIKSSLLEAAHHFMIVSQRISNDIAIERLQATDRMLASTGLTPLAQRLLSERLHQTADNLVF